jgi:hypothetical protein
MPHIGERGSRRLGTNLLQKQESIRSHAGTQQVFGEDNTVKQAQNDKVHLHFHRHDKHLGCTKGHEHTKKQETTETGWTLLGTPE